MITLPFELYSQKNSKQIFKNNRTGQRFITSSNVSKEHRIKMVKWMLKHNDEWRQEILFKPFPLRIKIKIYRKTKRAFDYINIVQGMFDAMTDAKWIPDDDMKNVLPVFEEWEHDKENPRVELEVLK